nr:reverse transcriptase domain-containing protein [Tanacetum cinerariifolium]
MAQNYASILTRHELGKCEVHTRLIICFHHDKDTGFKGHRPLWGLWAASLAGFQATRLYIGDTHIWSATGVQQGGTLRPLLFALVLHPLVHKIIDNCKFLLHAWYLDDEAVTGDSEEVVRVLNIIRVSGPCLGLELNIKKTNIFWPSCNGTKLREGLFHVTIRRSSLGVKLLRGAVRGDTYFISRLAMRRAVNVVDLMGLLPQLHDPLIFECLRAPHSQHFLLAIPIDGLCQHMSPVEYRTICGNCR